MSGWQNAHDPYAVLGVPHDADDATIKRAYRKLAAHWHPDRNSDPSAAEQLKRVIAAWEILSDSNRRRWQDQSSYDDSFTSETPPPTPPPKPRRARSRKARSRKAKSSSPREREEVPLTPSETELFTEFITALCGGDDVPLGDRLMIWMINFACFLALLFYGFRGAVVASTQEFEDTPAWNIPREFEHQVGSKELGNATTRAIEIDYASQRFWWIMGIGSLCVFCPSWLSGLCGSALMWVQKPYNRRGGCWLAWIVPEWLTLTLRTCGFSIIWILPHLWPGLYAV